MQSQGKWEQGQEGEDKNSFSVFVLANKKLINTNFQKRKQIILKGFITSSSSTVLAARKKQLIAIQLKYFG
jgi:hypothetical protein